MNGRRIALIAGAVLAVPALVGLGWVWANWGALSSFPTMPGAYEAKEMCSCLFVEGRDEEFCNRLVYQSVVPSQGRTVDPDSKSVTARALWRESTARWRSREHGCSLD